MNSLAVNRVSTTIFVKPSLPKCVVQQRRVLRPANKCFRDQYSPTKRQASTSRSSVVQRSHSDSTQLSTPPGTRQQVLAELQSLLEVVCRDYHPFCCGGVCITPSDKSFQLAVGQVITSNVLTQLISELHVVNTTSDNPLASVEDEEMADMLTSISDYTQYMLGQGQPVALIPTEVHVHAGTTTTDYPVPPKKSAVPGETIGTVVLVLPSAHSETQLEVKWTTGLTHTLELPETSADENRVQWVAYHGGCSHSVQPVTTGQLVTATYNIVRPQTVSVDAFSPVCLVDEEDGGAATSMYYRGPRAKSIADEVLKMLVEKVEEVQAAGVGSELGVMLSKRYSIQELTPKHLKGGDRLVWDALSRVWPSKLRPVLEDPKEVKAKGGAAAGGPEGEAPEMVMMYEVVDTEEVEEVEGGKLVVSSDGCFSPGVLWATEREVERGTVDEFHFRPAALSVNLSAKR